MKEWIIISSVITAACDFIHFINLRIKVKNLKQPIVAQRIHGCLSLIDTMIKVMLIRGFCLIGKELLLVIQLCCESFSCPCSSTVLTPTAAVWAGPGASQPKCKGLCLCSQRQGCETSLLQDFSLAFLGFLKKKKKSPKKQNQTKTNEDPTKGKWEDHQQKYKRTFYVMKYPGLTN